MTTRTLGRSLGSPTTRDASRLFSKDLLAKLRISPISAVDLFCGAGGLTHGLMQAGIKAPALAVAVGRSLCRHVETLPSTQAR